VKPTPHQERQIEFLRKLEAYEELDTLQAKEVFCRTCKKSHFGWTAQGAITFILEHAGHFTWVDVREKKRDLWT